MFRRGNPFVRAREETSSTHRVSHLRAGLSLSWPSHVHIQPNLLKSCQYAQVKGSNNDTHLPCIANCRGKTGAVLPHAPGGWQKVVVVVVVVIVCMAKFN